MTLLPGPEKGACEGRQDRCSRDDCPIFGTLLPASRDGQRRIRNCGDPVARGKRSRKSGLSAQRTARKRLGVAPSHKFGDANEERWVDPLFANEVKSGAQCGPVRTAFLKAEAQILSNEPDHGAQHKAPRVTWMPVDFRDRNGQPDGIVSVRLSVWEELVTPALDAAYGGPE